MNIATRNAALHAYGKQNLATQVEVASPHQLIVMLFEGAITACFLAKAHMQNSLVAEKGKAISKAIAIVEEGLRLSLEKDQGGLLATNLDALYEYMGRQLLQANLRNDADRLDEVIGLLSGLKESWQQINPDRAMATQQQALPNRTATLSYVQA